MYGPEINNDECTADVGPFGFMGCTTKGCSCEIKQAKHESTIRDLNTPNFKTRAKHESMRAIGWLSPEEITAVVEKNLQAYKEALAEANETTRVWKKRYNDLSAHINSINTQNAELAATVEALRSAIGSIRASEKTSGFGVQSPQAVRDSRIAWMKLNEALTATPQQHLLGVLHERDVLLAQLASFSKHDSPLQHDLVVECERAMKQRDEYLRTKISTAGHGGSHDTCFTAILRNHIKLNEQHLRDVRAETGRAGFIEGYDSCWFQHYGTRAPEHAATYSAEQYAASVKAGE